MADIFEVLFFMMEIGILVSIVLLVSQLIWPTRLPYVRKIWYKLPLWKKVQPDWTARCRFCGSYIDGYDRCPACGRTRIQAIDESIFNCLVVNGGVISRNAVATELHLSETELNESLERLSKAGRIVPHPTGESLEKYTS
jgi:hypothetical protein